MHLSAHQPQRELAICDHSKFKGAAMKSNVKTARMQHNQSKSPFSGVACLVLLLIAGLLVKVAAFTPIFHLAHWN
jgi:hypothetical protein